MRRRPARAGGITSAPARRAAPAALNGRVDALISVPHFGTIPDSVYAGGVFTSAGGNTSAVSIARWDGTAWHSIGAPPISTRTGDGVDAIAVDRATGKIYVGGNFVNAGGNGAADFLAVWDGASWKPFCAPITATVKALQIVERTLYVGGVFADGAGRQSADRLVGCNLDTGVSSSTVANTAHEIQGSILALTADSAHRLYAAGGFSNINLIPQADNVAMYDGTWHAMQAGAVNDITRSIASDGTNVCIGSDAVDIDGIAKADHVAKWNGTAWSALGGNAASSNGWLPATAAINAIATSGSNVFVAGSFQNADVHPTADMVAGFNGFSWAPMGSNGAGNGLLNAAANAITVFGGQVVAGGNFISAGGDSRANYIARYPGAAHPLTAVIRLGGGGFAPFVGSTASFDGTASDGDAPIVSYRWSFNDGSPDSSGPTVAHVLTKQGVNTVTLIVTDSAGRTAQRARTSSSPGSTRRRGSRGRRRGCSPGRPSRSTGVRDDNTQSGAAIHNVTVVPPIVPKVSHVTMTRKRFRVGSRPTAVSARAARGTSFRFTLKTPAKVTVTIARRARGARHCKRCISPRRAHGKRCTRAVKAGALMRKNLPNGGNAIAFSGRIGKRALKPGGYTAGLRARNAKGASKPVVVKFTVVK